MSQNYPNAVSRTVSDKVGEQPSVKDFGAKVDLISIAQPTVTAASAALTFNWNPSVVTLNAVTAGTPQFLGISALSNTGIQMLQQGIATAPLSISLDYGNAGAEVFTPLAPPVGSLETVITAASNTTPIVLAVVNAAAAGIVTGSTVTIDMLMGNATYVGGNPTGANGTWDVSVSGNNVTLIGSSGAGAFVAPPTYAAQPVCKNVSTLYGVFAKAHAAGVTVAPALLNAASIGKRVGIAGAGALTDPVHLFTNGSGSLGGLTGTMEPIPTYPPLIYMPPTQDAASYALIQAYAVGGPGAWTLWGSNDPTFATETQVYPPTSGTSVALNTYNSGPYQWDSMRIYGTGAISGPLGVGVTPVPHAYYRAKASSTGGAQNVTVIFATFGHYFGSSITSVTDCNNGTMATAATSSLAYSTYLSGIADSFIATDDTTAFENARDAMRAGNSTEYGTVLVPAGTALLTRPFHQDPSMAFYCQGSNATVKWDPYLTIPATNNNPGVPCNFLWNVGHSINDGGYQSFGTNIHGITFDGSNIPSGIVYSESMGELSELRKFSISNWNGNGPYGGTNALTLLGNACQNWHISDGWILPGSSTIPPPAAKLTQGVTVNNIIVATSSSGSVTTLTFQSSQTFGSATVPVTIAGAPIAEAAINGSWIMTVVDSTHGTIL